MKHTAIGILAHVDAGKTSMAEAMLYRTGAIKTLGRVDHKDAFLDTQRLERRRGITIFSKQAVFDLGDTRVTLLDTPGHMDFSAEMERTLSVLDYAILVISGPDGVQAHTATVWALLKRYQVPTFLWVNKMDLAETARGRDARQEILQLLQGKLSPHCVDMAAADAAEAIALTDEDALEEYLADGILPRSTVLRLVRERKVFPCWFGSALKLEGVQDFLDGLKDCVEEKHWPEDLRGRIFKITRAEDGARLTWIKLTGGQLKVREELEGEKISQIRIYSGAKYETADRIEAGQVAALCGPVETYAGQAVGKEKEARKPLLEPVLSHRITPTDGTDPHTALQKLSQLAEEDPMLRIVWDPQLQEICAQLMGEVQIEVLQQIIEDRFGMSVSIDAGHILYKETIEEPVEGVGHFEPLRHYAEVHLLMEPLPRGSGLVFDSSVSEDELDRNWQRLILTHLAERRHPGVLTGSPITDMKITLAAGRAHLKHTEGGDFRQATYRAVRQGLMRAKSILLEPWYAFRIEVPPEQIGRAISDVRAMNGVFESPEDAGDMLALRGSAPVSAMNGYLEELISYSRGRGRLSLRPDGYRPCHEQEKVVAALGYDPMSDIDNPADSVFCAHGAGFNVRWDQVPDYMHLESCLKKPSEAAPLPTVRRSMSIDERELEAIMEREFGPIRRPEYRTAQRNEAPNPIPAKRKKEYLIVDGYNLIFAWDELKKLAEERLDLARGRLMDMLSSYCGFTKSELVLVFDGFRTPGNPGERGEYHNIRVAYTADGETGDAYIERIVDEIGKNYDVRVVTSDNLIRLSALRSGVLRTSSKEFSMEVEWVLEQIGELLRQSNQNAHTTKLKMELKDGKQ